MPELLTRTSADKRRSLQDEVSKAKGFHHDLENLQHIGRSKGFPARLRRKIWPILLELDPSLDYREECSSSHRDEKQVLLDTQRSFTNRPANVPEGAIPGLKEDLQYCISQVLRSNPWLNYYQGYHDIAELLLVSLGRSATIPVLERLSHIYLRDYMLSTLTPSMSILRLVHQIIEIADPKLYYILQSTDTEPYYAISAILTWWIHSLDNHADACRVVDFLISSEPVLIIYSIAAVTILKTTEIAALEDDKDMIFLVLSKGPTDLSLDSVLSLTQDLYESIRPKQLRHWSSISKHSCFKTFAQSREACKNGTLRDFARAHFEAQEVELVEEEARRQRLAETAKLRPETQKMSLLALGVGVLALGFAWYIQHGNAA